MNGIRRPASVLLAMALAALVAACAYNDGDPMAMRGKPYKPYMVGPPYQIDGQWYYPKEDFDYDKVGIASWYGRKFHGQRTANGETYDMDLMTAAHPTLPMPTMVTVTNLENNRSVVVRINDRGPFHSKRIIDLSRRAAERLGLKRDGVGRVRVRVLRTASLELKREGLAEMAASDEFERRKQVAEQYRAAMTGRPEPAANRRRTGDRSTGPRTAGARTTDPVARRSDVRTAELDPAALARISPSAGPARPGAPIDIRPGRGEREGRKDRSPRARTPRATEPGEGDRQYYVQVGSFTERSNAVRIGHRLEGVALTRIALRRMNRTTFYRVRVGPFSSRNESREMLGRIRRAGYDDARIVVE